MKNKVYFFALIFFVFNSLVYAQWRKPYNVAQDPSGFSDHWIYNKTGTVYQIMVKDEKYLFFWGDFSEKGRRETDCDILKVEYKLNPNDKTSIISIWKNNRPNITAKLSNPDTYGTHYKTLTFKVIQNNQIKTFVFTRKPK